MTKTLFEPAALGGLKIENRMVRSATWEGIASPDGAIADTAYEIYEELAEGGVGAVITGFTSVSSTDFYMDDMMRLSRDELIGQYRCLTDLIHAQGIPVITQLALGAYYRPLPNGRYRQTEPDDMTPEEIRLVIDWFGEAAGAEEEAVMPQRSPIRRMEACSNPYSMNSSLAAARTFPWLAVLSRGTAVPSFRISIL